MPPSAESLIDAKRLSLLKPDAVAIQASRGGIVDEAALAVECTNLAPHIAGVTWQFWACLFRIAWRNAAPVLLDNQPPAHVAQ